MRILYHIPVVSQTTGGTRQYAIRLLNILAKDRSGNTYFVLHHNNDPLVLNIISKENTVTLIPEKEREKKRERFLRRFTRMWNEIFEKLNWKFRFKQFNYLNRICKKYRIDIVHSPNQVTPEASRAKKICTMHDIQEIHFPEYFTAEERRERAIGNLNSLRNADRIIVSYSHIKQDIIKYFQVPGDKISVCLLGMSHHSFNEFEGHEMNVPVGFSIPDKFLLYPANTYKHKNHLGLLEAIACLRDRKDEIVKVVCTGSKTQHFYDSIFPKITELKLEDQIQFLGIVDDHTLYSLYRKAVGVVIPTVYEAGSFPLMESILLQVPVVCSNVTSLPETIVDRQFVFDAFDIEDMADKISRLYYNTEYRMKNIDNSKLHFGKIVNTNALESIQSVYNEMTGTGKLTSSTN